MFESNPARGAHGRASIIAEIAGNHVGDLDLARRLVVEAAAAGADVASVEPHWYPTGSGDDEPGREWLERVTLSDGAYRELARLAAENGITFTSAPFTVDRARFLVADLGLRTIKVESSEMLNLDLLDYLNGKVQTVYLGTGLAELDEVRLAVSRLQRTADVVIMHSTDEYPLAPADAHLRAILTLAAAFPGHRVGYLDHTIGVLAPLLVVALGATVVEKHFTLDRSLPGTDHVLSITPAELSELVNGVRQAETLLGNDSAGGPERKRLELVPDGIPGP